MKKLMISMIALLTLIGCKKDEEIVTPPPPQEEEVITSVWVTFTDTQSQEEYVLLISDPDGDGGSAPVFTNDTLPANRSFDVSIRLFNETENPVEEITTEIEEEREEHQFFFTIGSALNLQMAYNDTDADGFPVGLANTATTGDSSSGQLTVTLRHLPNKSAENVAAGDITNAGGGTDAEVAFTVIIQ